MHAVIYARYSSDLQSDRSIEDQVRLCRARADRDGLIVDEVFTDHALSGGHLTSRPEMLALLDAAGQGTFEVVLAEALDRISRDQEDIAAIYKRLSYQNVRIVTLSEGEINELHIGLKGTMNALFLKDLAAKTRRGQEGRVRQGRSPGGLSFGYDVVREVDAAGEPERGKRRINEGEARTVRRIFEDFAQGQSPRAIAKQLNAEGVPGPRRRPWRDTTIRGHATRGTGILRNELYIGRLVWNRQRFVKDPATGKRVARPNPRSAWIIEEVPHLRVVDQDLWEQVQARLADIRSSEGVAKARKTEFWKHRRAKHLLTGLLTCAACGGAMTAVGKDYLACDHARNQGTCQNRKSVRRGDVETAVLELLKDDLMDPELVALFIETFEEEAGKLAGAQIEDQAQSLKELARVTQQLEGLYDAIADGLRTSGLQARLEGLEDKRAALKQRLDQEVPPAPALPPDLAGLYREKVADLQAALSAPETRVEAAEILRGLIERVGLRKTDGGLELELTGDIVAMVSAAQAVTPEQKAASDEAAVHETYISSVKVVAGAGFEPATFRL